MARPNPERRHKKTPVTKIVIIGIIVVAVIVALYYGIFYGLYDYYEEQEEPAVIEEPVSEKESSNIENGKAIHFYGSNLNRQFV